LLPVKETNTIVSRMVVPEDDVGGDADQQTTNVSLINDDNQTNACQECHLRPSLYQCPGCRIRTCCLPCCQAHKIRTKCTGKRPRSDFLPLCHMSDNSLRSDYFFLEEVLTQMPRASKVAKTMSAVTQQPSNQSRRTTKSSPKQSGSTRVQPSSLLSSNTNNNNTLKKSKRLLHQARKRNITLKILPSFMERHQTNTSWYCGPRDMITWKVECIVFLLSSSNPTKRTVLNLMISEHQENLWDYIRTKLGKEEMVTPTATTTPPPPYKLFLKRLPSPANKPRYIEISSNNSSCYSLRSALEGNTIIEHPTLYCVPCSSSSNASDNLLDQFPTTCDDDDTGATASTGLIAEVEQGQRTSNQACEEGDTSMEG
jgi:hypothetical protein